MIASHDNKDSQSLSMLAGQLALLSVFALLGAGMAWLAGMPDELWHRQYSGKLEGCFKHLAVPGELVHRSITYHPIGDHGAYEHAVTELRTPPSFRSLRETESIYAFQLRRMQQGRPSEDTGLSLRMLNPVDAEDLEPAARQTIASQQPRLTALIEVRYWEVLNHSKSDGLTCSLPK